jgi:hypothetical protein
MQVTQSLFRGLRNFVVAMATMASAAAYAIPVISNLPSSNEFGNGALLGGLTRSFAQGFTMPTGGAYSLDSVTMRLLVNAAGGTFNLELYEGSPNPAGSAVATFTVPTLNTLGFGTYTFTPDAAATLLPDTTYWLVAYSLTTGSGNQIQWAQSNPGVTPTGIATYAGARFNSPATLPPTAQVTLLNSFQIDATPRAVPEPSTVGLVFGSLAVVMVMQRRRNCAA